MRYVCWFSCGAASAVATKLAISQYGKDNLIIARCLVQEEHEDNNRFASDCEKWFDHPIINLMNEKYDGSIYKVFEKRRYISGIGGAPCTLELKKVVREKFQQPNDVHVFGYTAEEQDRYDHFIDANNVKCSAPLIDRGITHPDCLAMIENAGIRLPVMYQLGYKHNNCIGCVKATGAGYLNKIKKDFPSEFQRMAKLSKSLGVRLIRIDGERCFLDDLSDGIGNYSDEPEIQCGIFCHMAEAEYA